MLIKHNWREMTMGIEAIVAIITLVCSGFYWLIIKPLHDSILDLQNLIKEIRQDLKNENEKRAGIEVRLSVVEEQIENIERMMDK